MVIPAEARHALGYNPGDKLLFVKCPEGKGLVVFKLEHAKYFLEGLRNLIVDADSKAGQQEDSK